MKLINDYFELINKWLKEKRENRIFIKNWFNIAINIKLPEEKEQDDIEQIYEILKKIIEKERNSENNIINYNSLIKNLNKINEITNNLNNLIKLKKIINLIEKEKNQTFDKNLIKLNNESIHDIGITLAIQKFDNNQIINFIKNDVYYIDDKYESHSKRDPYVLKYFNIHEKYKSGFKGFVELELYRKFPNKKREFYHILIDQIKNFDDLNLLFELFLNENSKFLDYDFIDILI